MESLMRLSAAVSLAIWLALATAPREARADVTSQAAPPEQAICTYDTYRWNAPTMRAVGRARVTKPRTELSEAEVDPATGCSVCAEDQVEVRLEGVAPFRLCKHLAPGVERVLRELRAQGIPIHTVEGYRVGMTRGAVDAEGNRTRFSNHSFGIALDINEGANGLYESCAEIGPRCRLRKGGPWAPAANPLSMTADHAVVVAFRAIGMHWGGQLPGRQKDFMHFSPTGD
jgi:hypothetical protein